MACIFYKEKMKQQVVFITWATPKENYGSYYKYLTDRIEYNPYEEEFLNWNKTLWEKLWENFEYLRSPTCSEKFADYTAWKILFEKMLPFLREDVIIATTSLWSTFILKYIGENEFPLKIKKLFLVAPAIAGTGQEGLWSFEFDLEHTYNRVSRWAKQVYIYHSQDDDVVPYEQSLRLKQYFPEAIFREFYNRGHFFMESELPEIIEDINS